MCFPPEQDLYYYNGKLREPGLASQLATRDTYVISWRRTRTPLSPLFSVDESPLLVLHLYVFGRLDKPRFSRNSSKKRVWIPLLPPDELYSLRFPAGISFSLSLFFFFFFFFFFLIRLCNSAKHRPIETSRGVLTYLHSRCNRYLIIVIIIATDKTLLTYDPCQCHWTKSSRSIVLSTFVQR